jgi:protein SCO1
MEHNSERLRSAQYVVWGVLGAVILFVVALYLRTGPLAPGRDFPVLSQLENFALTNQLGREVRLDDLAEKVSVVNVIFTRCAGPCATITRQTREMQERLAGEDRVRFVSLTADPEYDTPEVLQRYALRFSAESKNWHFLTGSKREIYRLAIDDLKFTVMETPPETRDSEADLFIHSTKFVLVDGRGRVRGYFDGTEAETVEQVTKAVRDLLRQEGRG